VGHEGLAPSVLESIREAFNTRELLKVKLLESAPADVRETAAAIADALTDVHVAQTIGRTVVLYREDPDAPEIRLPR